MSGHFNIQIWSSIKTERQEKLSFVPYSTALYENGKHVVQVSLQVEGDNTNPSRAGAPLSHTTPPNTVSRRPTHDTTWRRGRVLADLVAIWISRNIALNHTNFAHHSSWCVVRREPPSQDKRRRSISFKISVCVCRCGATRSCVGFGEGAVSLAAVYTKRKEKTASRW